MQTSLKLINKKIREWNVSEGYTETQLPFLSVYHTRNNSILMPQHGRPYLFAVIDGFMRLHTPSGILDYNEGQYSISAIDTPSMGRVLAFSVEELAGRWNMSVPVLHQEFKSAVGMGLLQCQKRLRLTEARRLMLDENKNATEAALDVGYESLSQFTREYKKMFGAAPREDAKRLKTRFENQANNSEE